MEILAFLKEQLLKTQEDLKKLFIQRGKASIETVGSYDIMIERKKEEIEKLEKDIKEWEKKATDSAPSKDNPPSSNSLKDDIGELIEKGRIKEAIEKMKTFSKENGLILISGRYNRVIEQNNLGTISQTDYNIEMNRITNSLLSMLND